VVPADELKSSDRIIGQPFMSLLLCLTPDVDSCQCGLRRSEDKMQDGDGVVEEEAQALTSTYPTNKCPNTTPSKAKQRVIMASFNRERVEHALNELIVRIVPEDAEEDEDAVNQRFDEAFEFAIDTLSTAGDPPVVPDTGHIADLIDSRSRCDAYHMIRVDI
jgi:hypothetical protein